MHETITLRPGDLNVWARFSSDWNPIHFSEAEAQKAGYETLFAHGMLALLPLTHQMMTTPLAEKEWVKALFRFRAPTPLSEPLRIGLDVVANRVSAGLARETTPDNVCVYAAAEVQGAPPRGHNGQEVELYERYRGAKSDLDGLAFSPGQWNPVALLNARAFSSVLRERGHVVDFEAVKTVVADNYGLAYSMIQTSHSLVVCPSAATNFDALESARVLYAAHPVTRSASGTVSGFKASVLLGEQIVLQSDSMILIRPTRRYISGDDGNA